MLSPATPPPVVHSRPKEVPPQTLSHACGACSFLFEYPSQQRGAMLPPGKSGGLVRLTCRRCGRCCLQDIRLVDCMDADRLSAFATIRGNPSARRPSRSIARALVDRARSSWRTHGLLGFGALKERPKAGFAPCFETHLAPPRERTHLAPARRGRFALRSSR